MPEISPGERLPSYTEIFNSLFSVLEKRFKRIVLINFARLRAGVEVGVVNQWLEGQAPADEKIQEKIIEALKYLNQQPVEPTAPEPVPQPVETPEVPVRNYVGLSDKQVDVLMKIIAKFGTTPFTIKQLIEELGYGAVDILPMKKLKMIRTIPDGLKVANKIVRDLKK